VSWVPGVGGWPRPGDLRRVHITIAWIAAAIVGLILLYSRGELWRDWRNWRGATFSTTMARVRNVTISPVWIAGRGGRPREDTEVHGVFEFEVEGRTYSGTEFGRGGGRVPSFKARQLKSDLNRVGLVQVWYEVQDPSECYADLGYRGPHDPYQSGSSDLALLCVSACLGALLWATYPLHLVAHRRRRRRLGLLKPE